MYVLLSLSLVCVFLSIDDVLFFFKQKTAYEMRISDWSSDVCSSDLQIFYRHPHIGERHFCVTMRGMIIAIDGEEPLDLDARRIEEIGRASCRERECQYV